ncbi:MAG: LPS export ABC transporter periplasmic protein LptC [Spirochaetales bacterium]|nr:LPS export ABC transporter periplasmic protein LptC [Spirochaetales bacterium]
MLTCACSLDYNPARLDEEIAEEVPETVLLDFRHTIVTGDQVWVVLEASRAETYEKRKEIILEEVSFREYNSAGELVSEASADRAVYHTDTEDASASGTIRIDSPKEEASLEAGSLLWTREGKRLEAEPADAVRLQKQDGSIVEGRGFRADFRRRRIQFDGPVEGRYVWEEDE